MVNDDLTRDDPVALAGAGVSFPLVDGRRSTSHTGRAVVADALRAVDAEYADRVLAEPDWRRGYLDPFRRMTRLAVSTPDGARLISDAGLASVHRRFVVHDVGGADLPLDEAMARSLGGRVGGRLDAEVPALHTVTVNGTQPPGPAGLAVPYRGELLAGPALDRQLDAWLDRGIAEPSFAQAVRAVTANPQWLDLRDVTVVVLGAGAEMGPFAPLAGWGAHLIAVDLPQYDLWRRLIGVVRTSPGRMSAPVSRWVPSTATDDEIAAAAGADVIHQAPELLAWLATVQGPFTLGNYVYADGATHVRATVAIDGIIAGLERIRDDVSLAFLATPTDVYPVPQEVVAESERRYAQRTLGGRLGRVGSAGRLFARNYESTFFALPDGRPMALADSLVPQQGPNYALAKRIQRWRALRERAAGRLVSLNVAPATRTGSVVRNRALAAAYAGAHRFGVEVFEPTTSNTLMAAMLVHDLRNPQAPANPATSLANPAELLWQGAIHGGLWRSAFAPRSVLGMAVVLGMVQRGA